jgi:Ser/Thr protein kinase RdoA (MazF antagonist)
MLAPSLPPEVKCPDIKGCDSGAGNDLLVIARRPGAVLSRAWPAMPPSQRRVAVRQLGFMLKALHETPRPDDLPSIEELPQLLTTDESMEPTAPLLDALAALSLLEHVDEELVGELRSFVWSRSKILKPFSSSTLIHGDVTFENVLWDGQEVTALIDYEWSRGAPRDVDLDVLLRFCAYPKLHVAEDYEAETRAVDYEDVPSWLAEDYRELFGFHDEVDRVRLFAISYDVRELLAFPPTAPMYDLPEHHALRRLGRTLSGMSYIDAFGGSTRQLRS